MNYKIIIILLIALGTSASAENLLKNGDFEKGSSRWKGEGKANYEKTAEGKNRFMRLDVGKIKKHRDTIIYQDIKKHLKNNKTFKTIEITFKIRFDEIALTSNPYISAYLWGDYSTTSYSTTSFASTKTAGAWYDHKVTITYSNYKENNYQFLCIRPNIQAGIVDIDNVTAVFK